jgi:hypothetical protein
MEGHNMRIYKKALRILLIASILFASAYTNAHDYSFLKLLKVGQCLKLYGGDNTAQGKPLKQIELEPCDKFYSLTITHVGSDYIVVDNKWIYTAQSIGTIVRARK